MSEATVRKQRPKHLALNQIRLPLPGIVSILHRISGVGIFLMLPFLLYLLDRSLGSPETFETFAAVVDNWFIKLVLFGLLWAYLHHFCAGVRHLVMDVNHHAVNKQTGKSTAVAVLVISVVLTVVLGAKLFGLF